MHTLEPSRYDKVRPLFEPLSHHLATVAILERSAPAAICDADAALAGWCTSEYNSGERCEVGIGTLEPYQRRGLATAMGSAFVELALSRGVTQIGWHCWARNLPSVATALKIGYEKVFDYPTYLMKL